MLHNAVIEVCVILKVHSQANRTWMTVKNAVRKTLIEYLYRHYKNLVCSEAEHTFYCVKCFAGFACLYIQRNLNIWKICCAIPICVVFSLRWTHRTSQDRPFERQWKYQFFLNFLKNVWGFVDLGMMMKNCRYTVLVVSLGLCFYTVFAQC